MVVDTNLNMSFSLAAGILCGSHCSDLHNLILTFKFHTLLAHLCVALSYCIMCQKKEEKMNFKMMHLIFHELLLSRRKMTDRPGSAFSGTHCIDEMVSRPNR